MNSVIHKAVSGKTIKQILRTLGFNKRVRWEVAHLVVKEKIVLARRNGDNERAAELSAIDSILKRRLNRTCPHCGKAIDRRSRLCMSAARQLATIVLFFAFCFSTFAANIVPAYPPGDPTSFQSGLHHRFYPGSFTSMPDFTALTPTKTFLTGGFVPLRMTESGYNFAYKIDGYINVASSGTYTFYVDAADGVQLYIANTNLVVNGNSVTAFREVSGSIGLDAGKHKIELRYFCYTNNYDGIAVKWSGPSLGKQLILSGGTLNVLYSLADSSIDNSLYPAYMRAKATTQVSPPQISLNWQTDSGANATNFTIYRKLLGATNWGTALTTTASTVSNYVDSTVSTATAYEYWIHAGVNTLTYFSADAFICSAIQYPEVDSRGTVILIIDDRFQTSLATQFAQLQSDLLGDGWNYITHYVNSSDSVASVKALIEADYNADPTNVKAVYLFGRIPVPGSGYDRPGHSNSTLGFWPADVYYVTFDSSLWTDTFVDTTNEVASGASSPMNSRYENIIGDGYFDRTFMPVNTDLQIGRVDFDAITVFTGKTEEDLLSQYLTKAHNYRFKLITPPDDDLYYQNNNPVPLVVGYNSSSVFWGFNSINFYDNVVYYWNVINSKIAISSPPPLYADKDYETTFIFTYVSQVPDWDRVNSNLPDDYSMRTALGMPTYSLVSGATLYHNWYLHPMAIGKTIGYISKLGIDNKGLYPMTPQDGDTMKELMGDPTIRLDVLSAPSSLTATPSGANVNLSWTASPETVGGYALYRSTSASGNFARINSGSLTT